MEKHTRWFLFLFALIGVVATRAHRQDFHENGVNFVPRGAWSELTASMGKMHAAMSSMGPSGDSDVDFVELMVPHHQAAIDMAKTQLTYGKDPQMRRLAQEIITDQQSEIQLMQLWVKQHGLAHKAKSQKANRAIALDSSKTREKEH